MKREQKTKILLAMAGQEAALKGLFLNDLKSNLENQLGFEISPTTISALRKDLGWPLLRRKAVRVQSRLLNVEKKLDHICRQLNIDLPDHLKLED